MSIHSFSSSDSDRSGQEKIENVIKEKKKI